MLSWPGHDEFTQRLPARCLPEASDDVRDTARRRRCPRSAARRPPARVCVLAPNPSPMTLDGTNTWMLSEPDSELAVVVDPGPLDEGHLRDVVATAEAAGQADRAHPADPRPPRPRRGRGPVRRADRYAGPGARPGAAARRRGAGGRRRGRPSAASELRVVGTPGHTADSLCFQLPADARGADRRHRAGPRHDGGRPPRRPARRLPGLAAAAAGPDGRTAVSTRCCRGTVRCSADARGAVEYYLAHRANRLAQVETAVETRPRARRREVVAAVYADVDPLALAGRRAVGAGPAGLPGGARSDLTGGVCRVDTGEGCGVPGHRCPVVVSDNGCAPSMIDRRRT